MILLTLPAVKPSLEEEIVAIDPWSVVMVRKTTYNGGTEGSLVHISEGVGVIQVCEAMTDVIRMVEMDIKEHNKDDDDIIARDY